MSSVIDLFKPGDRQNQKVRASTPFKVDQVQGTLELLQKLAEVGLGGQAGIEPLLKQLQGAGTELLQVSPEQRVSENFNLAQELIAPQLAASEDTLNRSLASRGISGGGTSVSALGELRSGALSSAVNQALSRSFEESLGAKAQGSNILSSLFSPQVDLANILAQFVGGLGRAGTAGQSQSFSASESARGNITSSVINALGRQE